MGLLTQMRRQGKTWQDVADLLGLPDEAVAEHYHGQLSATLKTHLFTAPHPSNDSAL
jgi:hypothetical protein